MFAGHFGLAAAARGAARKAPVWALMVASQLPDIVFMPLMMLGVERMEQVAEISYGGYWFDVPYSHSLLSVLLLAVAAAWAGGRIWGKRNGAVLGGLVFSHWLLDVWVHRPDLPLLPIQPEGWPMLGLGLWTFPQAAFAVEALLTLAGAAAYWLWLRGERRSARQAGGSAASLGRGLQSGSSLRLVLAGGLMTLLLAAALFSDMP